MGRFLIVHKEEFLYYDYDKPTLILKDGMAHAAMHQHDKALDSFAQIIDLNDLSSKLPIARRVRLEVLNNQVFSLLKSPQKDKELSVKLWQAGIEGAKELKSEQRFNEALAAYDIMDALWSGEKDIKELRELTVHW